MVGKAAFSVALPSAPRKLAPAWRLTRGCDGDRRAAQMSRADARAD
jgi:hypothetical protein